MKKAPIDAYLLQLRGTSGSGKTTAMKKLIDVIGAKPIAMNDRMTKNEVYRGSFVGYDDVKVYILGDYSPHRSAGGCDTIPTVQQVIDLVEKYSKAKTLIVFEGLLLAHSWGAMGEYAHEKFGPRYINAFLDTPEDLCLERVVQRRASKGRDTEGDRAAKIEKNVRADYYRVQLCYERVVARGGKRVDINHKKAPMEFCNLAAKLAGKCSEYTI